MKMATHIVSGADIKILHEKILEIQGRGGHEIKDEEDNRGEIQDRVTRSRAETLLKTWKKICIEAEKAPGASTNLLESEADLEKLKNKLYIQTGEDTEDTWLAFEYYKLDPRLSNRDRDLYHI